MVMNGVCVWRGGLEVNSVSEGERQREKCGDGSEVITIGHMNPS